MFNNRMLAVAAVLVMAVPALGAATPIVVPPVPEQLVEGHTVFTVIEIVAATATNETRFAAAVAVLVREYQAENRAQRFPGVLWFNDQYLVNPYQNARDFAAFRYPCGGAVMAVNAGDPDPRVVIARVTAGNPAVQGDLPDGVDDVTAGQSGTGLFNANGDLDVPASQGGAFTVGDSQQTYNSPPWVKPYPGTYQYENDYAWVGADPGSGTVNATNPSASGEMVYSDTVVGTVGGSAAQSTQLIFGANFTGTTPWDYRESYLITDPNDHSWIIDKYEFYTRDSNENQQNVNNLNTKLFEDVPADSSGFLPTEHYPGALDPNGMLETEYHYPVWVVNILGSPVFVPDYGNAIRIGNQFIGENCVPFKDLLDQATAPINGAACGAALQDAEGIDSGSDTDVTLNAYNGVPPWTDNPCMGYQEPSRNGFCYGGQSAVDGCYHGPTGNCNDNTHYSGAGPEVDRCFGGPEYVNTPLRQYNALLYFKLEDLRVAGAAKDHCNFDATLNGGLGGCNPALSPDTNGCSEEQYAWGPNPPQAAYDWPCPANNDDLEGNSHPFHPTAPPHEEREECLPAFAGPNPTNHGGSSFITPGMRANDDGWFEFAAPCDYMHATRNIDIYFSPAGRPFIPPVRNFDVIDLEGSSAPFHDFHSAYPGVS